MDLETAKQVRKRKTNAIFNAHVWNLEKWYRLSYLQSIENKCMDIIGEKRGGSNQEIGIDVCTLFVVSIK